VKFVYDTCETDILIIKVLGCLFKEKNKERILIQIQIQLRIRLLSSVTLKVDGNEKQWGPGRRQMLGYDAGPW
jgi:hypothetical protein